MEIRPATERDRDELLAFPLDVAVGSLEPQRLRKDLEAGRLRWSWTWLAVDDGALVGRALWWGRADSTMPLSLDWLDVLETVPDRARLATELLDRAHRSFATTPLLARSGRPSTSCPCPRAGAKTPPPSTPSPGARKQRQQPA